MKIVELECWPSWLSETAASRTTIQLQLRTALRLVVQPMTCCKGSGIWAINSGCVVLCGSVRCTLHKSSGLCQAKSHYAARKSQLFDCLRVLFLGQLAQTHFRGPCFSPKPGMRNKCQSALRLFESSGGSQSEGHNPPLASPTKFVFSDRHRI